MGTSSRRRGAVVARLGALAVVAVLSACLAGCSSCGRNAGFHASFLIPPTVETQALVNQQTGNLVVSPMASYPAAPAGRAVMPYALDQCGNEPPQLRMPQCAQRREEATLDDLYDLLKVTLQELRAEKLRQPMKHLP